MAAALTATGFRPPVIERSLIFTVPPAARRMFSNLKLLLPATVNELAPGPLIFTLWVISGRDVARLIVPVTLKLISMEPAQLVSESASSSAGRNVQAPPPLSHSPSS